MTTANLGVPDIAGLVGVALMLTAYAASALGKIEADRPLALVANLIGALLVIYSLMYQWNISSFVLEAVWACFAAAGLVRYCLQRKRSG